MARAADAPLPQTRRELEALIRQLIANERPHAQNLHGRSE